MPLKLNPDHDKVIPSKLQSGLEGLARGTPITSGKGADYGGDIGSNVKDVLKEAHQGTTDVAIHTIRESHTTIRRIVYTVGAIAVLGLGGYGIIDYAHRGKAIIKEEGLPPEPAGSKLEQYMSLGNQDFQSQNWSEAVDHFREAYDLDRGNDEVAFLIGCCYQQMGDKANAKSWYHTAILINDKPQYDVRLKQVEE